MTETQTPTTPLESGLEPNAAELTGETDAAALEAARLALEEELERRTQRRHELAAEQEEAQATLDAAREALVEGEGEAADVREAQLAFTTLEEAVGALDGKIAALQARLQRVHEAQRRNGWPA